MTAPWPRLESLNGAWRLAASTKDETAFPQEFPHTVPVPGLVDLARDYDWRAPRFHHYACDVDAALLGGHEHVDLVLDQSMWTTAVWCNGRFSAMSNDCFLPQRFALDGALRVGEPARLVVRIGQVGTLPQRHQAGNDYERLEWIPGIWGDAWLHGYGVYQISGVLIVPEADLGGCVARVRIRRASHGKACARVRVTVRDASGTAVAEGVALTGALDQHVEGEVALQLRWSDVQAWHPESPTLYHLTAEVFEAQGDHAQPEDVTERSFGVRRFAVRGRDFLLNGERIRLRGGNVAFHRLLGDPERGALPWDMDFARRALCTIPREHNMNCLRVHIGSMYGRWYDEADRAGMLLLEEWPFWNVTATTADVHATFSRWIWALNHHPSIVMWDPGNECDLSRIVSTVVPAMKELDPARAWMHADADEEHPYHWALIPLHPPRAMGFTRSHEAIRDSARPVSVNEFGWFWIDGEGNVTSLTETVRQRWLPDGLSAEEHLAYQAWLLKECTEVWRRYDVASIQPFVYLSTSKGLTANWFMGPLGELRPKPVLRALAEAIAPLGVSWEVTSRHYLPGERLQARLFVFNDTQRRATVRVHAGMADASRAWLVEPQVLEVELEPTSTCVLEHELDVPMQVGSWRLLARVEGPEPAGLSEKIVDVMSPLVVPDHLRSRRLAVLDAQGEVSDWLRGRVTAQIRASVDDLTQIDTLIVVGDAWLGEPFQRLQSGLGAWLGGGGRLVMLQPDDGLSVLQRLELAAGIELAVQPEFDPEAGGYDTVVLPTAEAPAALLQGMPHLHLGYFNGGLGNIVAGESDLSLGEGAERWLVCGLARKRTALAVRRVGQGLVLASRLHLRGRLLPGDACDRIGEETFARRPDPLAQQLLLNILGV